MVSRDAYAVIHAGRLAALHLVLLRGALPLIAVIYRRGDLSHMIRSSRGLAALHLVMLRGALHLIAVIGGATYRI